MLPAAPPGSPADVAATMAALRTGHGLTRIYTAACQLIAVISVTAGLTAWTNGHQIWCTHAGQHYTWPAADIDAAAGALALLARPAAGA